MKWRVLKFTCVLLLLIVSVGSVPKAQGPAPCWSECHVWCQSHMLGDVLWAECNANDEWGMTCCCDCFGWEQSYDYCSILEQFGACIIDPAQ